MLTWDVDERRAHPWTRLYVKGMWLHRDKTAFEGAQHTLDQARRLQESGDAPPTRLTRLLTRVRRSERHGLPVWVVRPRRGRPVARVVYVHGGGYVHPLTPDYWRLVRALVRAPAEVVLPAYPLAPGATLDDGLPHLLEVVREDGATDLPTVLAGDSAGGALVLALARRLVDGAGPVPAGVLALSPWLDAELAEDEVRGLESSDPMLAESGLREAGRRWAGECDPGHPWVSPVHLDLDGLPPVDLFVGDQDILRPAVDRLAERARSADVTVRVHERPSMFHVWVTRAIPEARRTRRRLRDLVRHRASRVG
ncbi:alpha/beta hydrolase fold domain-containing protein [Nocardioides perillae]|uniref:Acetyl esterase/lipase n=1 Tax=Nocardioides perillae TaxID=1119534 RepID=A0A7Y9RTH4_9ACTN|nr:alpha/beta hydrolase fold domain-containing protein [Nocardioides perillae]NYG55039.1 acetyl esterase/lipase [Nocardioides perillae]